MLKLHLHHAAILLLAFSLPSFVSAQDFVWTGAGQTANWSDIENWDGVEFPPVSSDATAIFFNDPTNQSTTFQDISNPFVMKNLTITSSEEIGFTLAGEDLEITGGFLELNGPQASTINNNVKLVNGSQILGNQADSFFNGNVSSERGQLVGTINMSNQLTVSGGLTSINRDSSVSIGGETIVDGGGLRVHANATLKGTQNGNGQLSVINGSGIDLQLGFVEKDVFISADSLISGNGTIIGNLTADGLITPGNSAGTINIDGDVDMDDTTVTCIELSGSGDGDFDVLDGLSGFNFLGGNTAFLDGTLEVSLIDGFIPDSADEFMFIQNFTIIGEFDNTGGNNLTGGTLNIGDGIFQVEYGATHVRLFDFQAIPEPTSLTILGVFAAGLFARRRRS